MPVKVIILLAYGVGLVMGFVIGRLYPKRTPDSFGPYLTKALFVYVGSFVVGYLLGLFS